MTSEQEARVLDLLTDLPWADVDDAIRPMEQGLRLALEATEEAFSRWEGVAEDKGVADEFSLTRYQVGRLSPEERLAYVGRLLRSIGRNYGVSAGFDEDAPVGEADSWSPAEILRGLNDISWMPITTERDLP